MDGKVIKVYFIYGLLYLLAEIVMEVFLVFLFGGHFLKTVFSIVFGIIFAWIAGYKGVKALRQIPGSEKFGSPYSQGMTIVLFGSVIGALFTYLLSKEIAFQGIIYILGGAYGGKLAAEKLTSGVSKGFKIILIVIFGLFSLIAIFLVGNSLSYRLFNLKTEQQGQTIKYTDNKFGYSFSYPITWEKKDNPFTPGYVVVISKNDPQTSIGFWYKDSEKISNMEQLRSFVEDDAKYSEENQQGKLESIEETVLNGKPVLVSTIKYVLDQGYSYDKQYYIADFNAPPEQNIYVWLTWVETQNKTDPANPQEVESILNSYTLL